MLLPPAMLTPRPLDLLLLSGAAVAAAGLGAALGAGRRLTPALVGWAGASAAGLMLGVAYALVSASLASSPFASAGGAALAVLLLHAAHAGAGGDTHTATAPSARAAVRASAIHSAAEGLAVGAAVALGPAFGVVLALTLIVHNVSEAAVLGAALRDEGRSPGAAAVAAALARAGQVVLAVATLAVVVAQPAALPWALGAGFGGLLYLLFAELLPDSYQAVGRTGIALVVSLAAGIVALLGGGARGGMP
jgi:ZIP family zinc transporter